MSFRFVVIIIIFIIVLFVLLEVFCCKLSRRLTRLQSADVVKMQSFSITKQRFLFIIKVYKVKNLGL